MESDSGFVVVEVRRLMNVCEYSVDDWMLAHADNTEHAKITMIRHRLETRNMITLLFQSHYISESSPRNQSDADEAKPDEARPRAVSRQIAKRGTQECNGEGVA